MRTGGRLDMKIELKKLKAIAYTDKFTELPTSTRMLYFYFLLNQDQYGKVFSPNSLIKMVGCSNFDAIILANHDFIVLSKNGDVFVNDGHTKEGEK